MSTTLFTDNIRAKPAPICQNERSRAKRRTVDEGTDKSSAGRDQTQSVKTPRQLRGNYALGRVQARVSTRCFDASYVSASNDPSPRVCRQPTRWKVIAVGSYARPMQAIRVKVIPIATLLINYEASTPIRALLSPPFCLLLSLFYTNLRSDD